MTLVFIPFFVDAWSSLFSIGYVFQVWQREKWHPLAFFGYLAAFHLSSFLGSSVIWRLRRLPRVGSTGWQIVCYTAFPFGAVLAAMANHSSSWAIYMLLAGLFRPETPATLNLFAQLDVSDPIFRQLVQWREFGSLLGVLAASCSLTFMFEYGQDALAIFSICQTCCCVFPILSLLKCQTPRALQESERKWVHVSQLDSLPREDRPVDRVIDSTMWWSAVTSAVNYGLLGYLLTVLMLQTSQSRIAVPVVVLAVSLLNWAGSLAGVREANIQERSPLGESFVGFVVLSLSAIIASLGLSMLYQGPSYYMAIPHAFVSAIFCVLHASPLVLLHQTVHRAKEEQTVYADRYLGCVYLGRLLGISVAWLQYVYLDASPYLLSAIAIWVARNQLIKALNEWKATRFINHKDQ